MSACIAAVHAPRSTRRIPEVRLALLGTGTVGTAVLHRLAALQDEGHGAVLSLCYAGNSRFAARSADGLCPRTMTGLATRPVPGGEPPGLARIDDALCGQVPRIVLDATASDAVAAQHAGWLSRGIHVVTACKLGQGTSLQRWRAINAASQSAGSHYGDSATVGAGLPLLRSIRDLRAGGDRIHAVAGVLSGSLAWLFNHYDGLSGEDVRRKLLILARAAGVELEADAVEVGSLVPPDLAQVEADELDTRLEALDRPLRERFAEAYRRGEKLRFIARLQDGRARVGLESLADDHPLCGGTGTDNRLAIWSDRYGTQPLVIQGPGAGAGVTAAALLDDALRIAAQSGAISTR